MPQVARLPEEDSPILPAAAASLVEAYQRASKADATLRAYRADAAAFEAWCAPHGFPSLPASPEAAAAFLVAEAETGRAASTINRRLAVIRYAHKLVWLPDLTEDEVLRATPKGIRRNTPRNTVHIADQGRIMSLHHVHLFRIEKCCESQCTALET